VRIVADSNTYISAVLWGGLPSVLLELEQRGKIELCVSRNILQEVDEVLRRPRFATRLAALRRSPAAIVRDLRARTVRVSPADIAPTARDADDDVVLATALSARARAIVSGDKDLLVLGRFRGIPILTAREFLRRFFPDWPVEPQEH
jgi:uncharacterized protein